MKNSMIIYSDELSVKWIDRLVDAGVGVLGIHLCGGDDPSRSMEQLVARTQTTEYRNLIDYARSRGLEIEYEAHACAYLLQRDLFQTHPEYFRMDKNGERTGDYNLCVSNSAAVDLVARRAAELAQLLYGSNHNFYFWLDDGRELSCQCPLCRTLSPSDQQLLVLNRMIREIRKYIPDARLAYLAYLDSMTPPASIKPEEGIFLEYAPFAKYTAKGPDAAERIAWEREMILPLLRTFAGEPGRVLEYWYDNSLFSGWKKPPKKFVLDAETMRADIVDYRRMGFDAISTFACFLGEDYEALHGEVDITAFGRALLQ